MTLRMIKILPIAIAMLATTYSTSVLAAQFESVIYAVASPEIFKSSNGWADIVEPL